MIDKIKDAVEFFYFILMNIYQLMTSFLPSPFSELFIGFTALILLLLLIKLANIIGGLVQNIIGVFT